MNTTDIKANNLLAEVKLPEKNFGWLERLNDWLCFLKDALKILTE